MSDAKNNKTLRPHINLWLERDGRVALSGWRVALLEAIGETGSITEAAAQMDVPYRVAWAKIKEMEQSLGTQLVESRVGGTAGGSTHLTPAATEVMRRYHHFSTGVEELVQQRFRTFFDQVASE